MNKPFGKSIHNQLSEVSPIFMLSADNFNREMLCFQGTFSKDSSKWKKFCNQKQPIGVTVVEMGPAVNMRPTRIWPGYFSTRSKEGFWPEVKNLKNLMFLGEIFQIQTQTINGWPGPITTL